MKSVSDISKIYEALSTIKKDAPLFATNFFCSEENIIFWISESSLKMEVIGSTLFIFRKDRDFYHLYFATKDLLSLGDGLKKVASKKGINVADNLFSDRTAREYFLINAAFCSSGFFLHKKLVRMRKILPVYRELCTPDPDIDFPKYSEVSEISSMLEMSFDRYAEQLPTKYEILIAMCQGEITIVRVGREIAGVLMQKKTSSRSTLCHLLVKEKFQGRKIGSKLLTYFINNATHIAELFVIESNTHAIEVYQHYGFERDTITDEIYININNSYETKNN